MLVTDRMRTEVGVGWDGKRKAVLAAMVTGMWLIYGGQCSRR